MRPFWDSQVILYHIYMNTTTNYYFLIFAAIANNIIKGKFAVQGRVSCFFWLGGFCPGFLVLFIFVLGGFVLGFFLSGGGVLGDFVLGFFVLFFLSWGGGRVLLVFLSCFFCLGGGGLVFLSGGGGGEERGCSRVFCLGGFCQVLGWVSAWK